MFEKNPFWSLELNSLAREKERKRDRGVERRAENSANGFEQLEHASTRVCERAMIRRIYIRDSESHSARTFSLREDTSIGHRISPASESKRYSHLSRELTVTFEVTLAR